MKLDAFLKKLSDNGIRYEVDASMKCRTTFKIGGNADVIVYASDTPELSLIIMLAKRFDVPIFLLGRGSNILVSDAGIRGAVISLSDIEKIEINENCVKCGAGVALSRLCNAVCDASLSGLEFAFGIPGSVGGALYMNAGAYGGEISECVKSAICVDENGKIIQLATDKMQLGYRTSIFKSSSLFISEVVFKLAFDASNSIRARMNDYLSRRKEKQPLDFPSAGSTFKRPAGHFAGALIEKNELKGYAIGGACVSEKHAGFIVNTGNATCQDVIRLIDEIKKIVFENDGIMLEPEIIAIGRGINQEV